MVARGHTQLDRVTCFVRGARVCRQPEGLGLVWLMGIGSPHVVDRRWRIVRSRGQRAHATLGRVTRRLPEWPTN